MLVAGDRVVCLRPREACSAGGVIRRVVPGLGVGGEDVVILEGWSNSWLWPISWFEKEQVDG